MTPESSQEDDLPNSPEALGLAPTKPEQATRVETSAKDESPEALQEKIKQDVKRVERAPEILARIESLAETSMPMKWVMKAHPELVGIHINQRFHVTKDNQLIFFTDKKAYLLPATTTFETGKGSIFPTDEDKALFDGSLTTVLESSHYIDSTPILQHLAFYRYLNLKDPNRGPAIEAAIERAEKTLDSVAQTLKPAAPATEQSTTAETDAPATGIAPPGALTPSMPSARQSMPSTAQPPASQGSSTGQAAAAA